MDQITPPGDVQHVALDVGGWRVSVTAYLEGIMALVTIVSATPPGTAGLKVPFWRMPAGVQKETLLELYNRWRYIAVMPGVLADRAQGSRDPVSHRRNSAQNRNRPL